MSGESGSSGRWAVDGGRSQGTDGGRGRGRMGGLDDAAGLVEDAGRPPGSQPISIDPADIAGHSHGAGSTNLRLFLLQTHKTPKCRIPSQYGFPECPCKLDEELCVPGDL